jgi:hypothetical protein
VIVLAPFDLIGNKISITTEPIDISGATNSKTVDSRILYSSKVRFRNNQVPVVRVSIEVEKR